MYNKFKKFSKLIFGGTVVMSTVFSNAGVVVNAMESAPPPYNCSAPISEEDRFINDFFGADCPPQVMPSNFLETDAFKIFLKNVDEEKIKEWEDKDCWKDFSEKEGTSVNALKSKSLKSLAALYALVQKHLDKKDKVYKKAIALKKDLERVFNDNENMKNKVLDFFAKSTDRDINSLLSSEIKEKKFFIFKDYLYFLGVSKQDPIFVKVCKSEMAARAVCGVLDLSIATKNNKINKIPKYERKEWFLAFLDSFKKITSFIHPELDPYPKPQQWRMFVINTICSVGESIENQPAIKKIIEYLREENYSENVEKFIEGLAENLQDILLEKNPEQSLLIRLPFVPGESSTLAYAGPKYVEKFMVK